MIKKLLVAAGLVIAVFLLCLPDSYAGTDPGIADTVYIGGGPLRMNQSLPITLSLTNDEPLYGWSLGFLLATLDSGFVRLDSAVWIGRMVDPGVIGMRFIEYCACEATPSVSPDVIFSGASYFGLNPLPIGRGGIAQYYFTGLTPGTFSIDSTFFPPSNSFALHNLSADWRPGFVGATIEVLEGTPPPAIGFSVTSLTTNVGQSSSFQVSGTASIGGPVTLTLSSLTAYDDDTQTADNLPIFTGTNPKTFQWTPASTDVGIWSATFTACDTSGTCTTGRLTIQVLENSSYSVAFDKRSLRHEGWMNSLAIGDSDNDGVQEILATSFQSVIELFYYGFDENPAVVLIDSSASEHMMIGATSGLVDGDILTDFAVMKYASNGQYSPTSLLSNGDNTFDEVASSTQPALRSCLLAELSNDAHLDLAAIWEGTVYIFAGDSQGHFTDYLTFGIAAIATSLNSGDFNGDGKNDLAIGTATGTKIYLNQGGSFANSYSYSQTNGSTDIEVTNQGSDFNNDGRIDLCISTPSVGGLRSQMVVYYGNANGSFNQAVVRDVKGHILGNCVGDINGDGELDIVFINSSQQYLGVLFGDSNQSFKNEMRIPIPEDIPRCVTLVDADLDADLDIVVTANNENPSQQEHWMILYENQLNPSGFERRHCNVDARDNASLSVVSPTGKIINEVRNTVASSSFQERNADSDPRLDSYVSFGTVESGRYIFKARPRPEAQSGESFTIEFLRDGQQYRLARDVAMTPQGFDFGVSFSANNNIVPRPGSFSMANPPSLMWPGQGQFNVQVASDPGFSSLIVNTVSQSNSFVIPQQIPVQDTTTVYWRVKPTSAQNYDCIYALNLLATPTGCGDVDGNQIVTISDIVFLINYIFAGGQAPNPLNSADADCSGNVNISDAVFLINYIFVGGPSPCSGC